VPRSPHSGERLCAGLHQSLRRVRQIASHPGQHFWVDCAKQIIGFRNNHRRVKIQSQCLVFVMRVWKALSVCAETAGKGRTCGYSTFELTVYRSGFQGRPIVKNPKRTREVSMATSGSKFVTGAGKTGLDRGFQ
jgi:hypothetical protein